MCKIMIVTMRTKSRKRIEKMISIRRHYVTMYTTWSWSKQSASLPFSIALMWEDVSTHTAEDKRIGNTRNTQGKRKSQRTCEEKQICVNEPFSMCVVHKQHGFQLLAANNNNKISKFQCNHDHYHKYRNIVIHLCIKIHFYILPKFTIHTHARSHLSRIVVTIETSRVSCCHAYSLSPVEISWTLLTFHRHFFNALVAYNWEWEKKTNDSRVIDSDEWGIRYYIKLLFIHIQLEFY